MTMTPSGLLTERRAGRDIPIGQTTPEKLIAGLVALGHSEPLAWAIADGALGSRTAAMGLARRVGLLAKIDDEDARRAGLIGR